MYTSKDGGLNQMLSFWKCKSPPLVYKGKLASTKFAKLFGVLCIVYGVMLYFLIPILQILALKCVLLTRSSNFFCPTLSRPLLFFAHLTI